MDDLPVDIRIETLSEMTTGQLAKAYEHLHGCRCRTRHRAYLIRKVAWRMQANAEGDLSERARRRAAELADDAEVRVMAPRTVICPPQTGEHGTVTKAAPKAGIRDPRLPEPGSALVRQYKGRTLTVLVLDEGFEWDGERYRTLTAIAKKASGTHVNGFRFFGLTIKKEA